MNLGEFPAGVPSPAGDDQQWCFAAGISVFFPAFNDAPALPALLRRTFETLRRLAADYEVIVVNDGSSDETADVLRQLQEEYAPYLRIVTHETNRGYGAALRSGFAAATKEYIFYTDGDGQYDPAELEKLLRSAPPGAGLVNGYKMQRCDPWHRVAIGWLYNRFARWLFRIRLRDIDCDFRLIRRSALDLDALHSTGGTICVELVRALELSGAGVAEVPVHHYPRRHGRSQFFRVRSLAVTFGQLCEVYLRLVVAPILTGAGRLDPAAAAPFTFRQAVLVICSILALGTLAYLPGLQIPFMSTDYLQLQLARDYGPVSHWGALAQDALHRCRATSLVLTYWIERAFGFDPFPYNAAGLLLHLADSLLVFALGCWRLVGWRAAALAACFFAICHRHSEAVVWYAAVPELLVFFFVLAGLVCWIRWMQAARSRPWMYAAALAAYALALLSKESAVVMTPLCALAVLCDPRRPLRKLWGAAPFAMIAAVYFALAYGARVTHAYFQDGTFSFHAPFPQVLLRTVMRLLWVCGAAGVLALCLRAGRPWRRLAGVALGWMVICLAPYSFLTYMPWVPSRNTYLASVGLSLIVAAGLLAVRQYARPRRMVWLVPVAATLVIAHEYTYQWTVKFQEYTRRARPTENLLRVAAKASHEIHAKCFPYSPLVGNLALQLRLSQSAPPELQVGPAAAQQPDAIDFCNVDVDPARPAHHPSP